MFLDFDTNILFGNNTQKLGPLSQRDFTAKSPANAHLSEQNFLAQQALLLDHERAERMDRNLCDASACASNSIKRFHRPWWSIKLTKARVRVDILCRLISGYKTNTDVRGVLLESINSESMDLTLPETLEASRLLYNQESKILRTLEATSLKGRHTEMEARANVASADGKRDQQKLLDKLCMSEARAASFGQVQF
jgi:hypothetical protein